VCKVCQHSSLSDDFFANTRHKYGDRLRAWIAYQSICHDQSYGQIQRGLKNLFNIYIDRATLYREKTAFIETYQQAHQLLLEKLLQHHVIHIDETKVHLRDRAGYVWVLTNGQEVYFLYKDSREGEFLHELLKNYNGVLVSDFYNAYDSLHCPQQKCLVHLIRDLNNDLSKHISNEEFRVFVQDFSTLLKKIIATIDRYGLKKYHLNKHHKDVERFFRKLINQGFATEVTQQYQKRLVKNKEKLFTFLDYDNVSWNNNAAEHVIKYFAMYRDKENGHFTKKGLSNHLILLSLYHSCRYMEVNFLDFLISQERNLSTFVEEGGDRR
jgi:hypothetical protein